MTTKETKVGKYIITSKIAQGGMGAIYKAKHPTLNRDVILKRLTLRQSSSIAERFKREAKLMIDFRNDHIVQVYDHFKEGNSYYIAMEFVDGISLGDLIKKKRYMPNEIAMLIFSEICKALKYAHDKGVIHRDIKPANVLVSKEGQVKLTDFGIARSKDYEDDGLTSAGMTLGTPAYMSPEQISDTKNVDRRADIYSMGVMLYEMVTGKSPFPGSFTPEAISLIQKGEYVPPRKINPKVSPVIQKVIKKSMHCKVKNRYKNLQYIIAILGRHLKKYKDQKTINNTIKEYLYHDKIAVQEKSKIAIKETIKKSYDNLTLNLSSNLARIGLAIALSFIILLGVSFYFFKKGYHYEYLKAREYGALRIIARVSGKYKKPEENYINASLFRMEKNKYKRVNDIIFNFKVDKNNKKTNYYSLKSQKVYLKTSNYRIRVNIENELYQKDFYLNPRITQKKERISYDAKIIQFKYKTIPRLPLKVYYSVKDINTRNDITNETGLFIYYYKKWLKWEVFTKIKKYKEILTSGKKYRFKLINKGYYTKYLRLYILPYQTILALEVDLVPIPGILKLKSNYAGLDILLNNSNYYFSGGKDRRYKKIKPSTKKYQKLLLPPGDYFITVKESGSLSKTTKVNIESRKSTKAIIDYNSNKNLISLNIYKR